MHHRVQQIVSKSTGSQFSELIGGPSDNTKREIDQKKNVGNILEFLRCLLGSLNLLDVKLTVVHWTLKSIDLGHFHVAVAHSPV